MNSDTMQQPEQPMAFNTPKSEMATRVAYNPKDKVLSITFRNGGKTAHLVNVPVEHFHGLRTAESLGRYYHKHIRDKYPLAR